MKSDTYLGEPDIEARLIDRPAPAMGLLPSSARESEADQLMWDLDLKQNIPNFIKA